MLDLLVGSCDLMLDLQESWGLMPDLLESGCFNTDRQEFCDFDSDLLEFCGLMPDLQESGVFVPDFLKYCDFMPGFESCGFNTESSTSCDFIPDCLISCDFMPELLELCDLIPEWTLLVPLSVPDLLGLTPYIFCKIL